MAAMRCLEEHLVRSRLSAPDDEATRRRARGGDDDDKLPLPPLPLFALPADALCGSVLDDSGLFRGQTCVEIICEGLVGVFIVRDDEMVVRVNSWLSLLSLVTQSMKRNDKDVRLRPSMIKSSRSHDAFDIWFCCRLSYQRGNAWARLSLSGWRDGCLRGTGARWLVLLCLMVPWCGMTPLASSHAWESHTPPGN